MELSFRRLVVVTLLSIGTIMQLQGRMSIQAATPPTTAAPTTAPAPFHYECNSDGKINISLTDIQGYGSMAVGPKFSNGNADTFKTNADCVIAVKSPVSKNFSVSNCGTSFYVYLMKESNTKPGPLIGGNNFHVYEISCDLPGTGILRKATHPPINAVLDGNKYEHGKTDYNDFQATMDINPPKPKIGQKMTITIKEVSATGTGIQRHYVLPKKCTASGGGETLELITNGNAGDTSILSKFDVQVKGSATATMYAFSFISSTTVELTCEVKLCETKSCVQAYNTKRRRSLHEDASDNTFKVSAEYKIEEFTPTSGQLKVGTNPATLFLVITAMVVGLKIRDI